MSKTRILHIGDLHYNNEMKGVILKQLEDEIIPSLQNNQSHEGKFDIIVSTGDIPSRSPETNLAEGFNFLNMLRKAIGSPPLLVSMGNHDVKRPAEMDEKYEKAHHYVCADFINEFNSVRKKAKNKFVRPLYSERNPSVAQVKVALKALISAKLDRRKLKNEQNDLLPFLWLWKKKVFCYLLSTVDYSAVLYAKKGSDFENACKDVKSIKGKKKRDRLQKLLKLAFMRDVPYVRPIQMDVLKSTVEYLRKHPDTQDQFDSSTKIAIFHHPLILLPHEAQIRDFDSVANGPYIASRLTSLGFHIFLYGHKHYERTSINFGNWTNGSTFNTKEFVGICGGRIFSGDGPSEPIFQILEVEDVRKGKFYERAASVKKLHTSPAHLSDAQRLMSLGKNAHPNWVYYDNKSLLVREDIMNDKLCNLVSEVEKTFRSTSKSDWTMGYKNADAFLFEFIDFLEGYCKGQYGLDKEFLSQLEKDLKVADALYFIDKLESPAWAHPNFMHHLALQIKAYFTRNHTLLKSGSWLHSDHVEQALRNRPGPKKGRIVGERAPKQPNKLDLDICRILIWDKKKLNTIFGRTLIMLHDVFNILLFFLDKQYYDEEMLKFLPDDVDFHLVINKDKSVKGFAYDEAKRSRQPIEAEEYLISYKKLLADPKLKYAKQVAGLKEWK